MPKNVRLWPNPGVDSSNLTGDTWIAFAMMHISMMQMGQSTDYLYRSGSLDRELWEAEMNRLAGVLSAPGVRQWWDAGGRTQLTPRFAEFLESTQSSIEYWNWDAERGFFGGDKMGYPAPQGARSPWPFSDERRSKFLLLTGSSAFASGPIGAVQRESQLCP